MKIKIASKDYAGEISKMMLEDLKSPDKRFPKQMILKLREHAQKNSVRSEFSNPNLMSFLALENNKLKGFIVGYKESKNNFKLYKREKITPNLEMLWLKLKIR